MAAAVSTEFDFGRAFGDTFAVLRQNWAPYLALSALFVALPTLAGVWLVNSLVARGAIDVADRLGLIEVTYGRLAAIALTGVLMTGAVLHGAMGYFDGRRVSLADCLGAGLRNWPALFVINWLAGIAVLGGFLLLIVPGVILSLAWYVVAAARVVEGRPILACFGRSADLTRGHRWALLGFAIVVGLLTFVVGLVGGFAGGFIAGFAKATGAAEIDAQLIALPLTYLFTSPLQAAAMASAYAGLARRGREESAIAAVFA